MNIQQLISSIKPQLPPLSQRSREGVLDAYMRCLDTAIRDRQKLATTISLYEIDILYHCRMELRMVKDMDAEGVKQRYDQLNQPTDDTEERTLNQAAKYILGIVGKALQK